MNQGRPRSSLLSLLTALWLLLLGGAGWPLTAQKQPIGLRCEIAADSLRSLYGPAVAEKIATQFCNELSKLFRQHRTFSLWQYGAGSGSAATLRFQVLDGVPGETLLVLRFERGDAPPVSWRTVWRRPGETSLQGDPIPDQVPRQVVAAFAVMLDGVWSVRLQEQLRKVPLASAQWVQGAAGSSGIPRLVSSLPWRDYRRLRNSEFRVTCNWPARREEAYLESKGLSVPGRYLPDGAATPYEALMLVARRRIYEDRPRPVEEVLGEVRQLFPKWVFLQNYEDPDVEVFTP